MKERALELIKEAYLDLNQNTPESRITVKGVTERAGISRATFYTYFENIESLVDEMEDVLLAEMEQLMSMWQYISFQKFDGIHPIPNVQFFAQYVEKNRKALNVLGGKFGRSSFSRKMREIIRETMTKILIQEGYPQESAVILASAYVGSTMQLCEDWVSGEIHASVDQMAILMSAALAGLQKEFDRVKQKNDK